METVVAISIFSLGGFLSLLMVAVGLGMVIFVHELGHFAVAKWCGVEVERFSIGFGPVLWSRKWGETEYALSAIPLGGYVKMVGQDDLDPGQETSSEIQENPRSYTAKSVPQRMAIISAGVIMNIITGYLFYTGAMAMGTQVPAGEVGIVQPGMPAWEAGLRPGDKLSRIGSWEISDFIDVTRATALSTDPSVKVVGTHQDGTAFEFWVQPDTTTTKRLIGVGPQSDIEFYPAGPGSEANPVAWPGSPAALKADGFQGGDRIVAVAGVPVENHEQLRKVLSEHRAEAVEITVARRTDATGDSPAATQEAKVTLAPQPMRSLGIRMHIGEINAVQKGSPAAEQGLKPADRIIRVRAADAEAALEVGRDLDPARLPDWFADHAGQQVAVTVEREGAGEKSVTVNLTPTAERNWAQPAGDVQPMPIPAIGVAYHFIPTVLAVEPGSPADKADLKPEAKITHVRFIKPESWPEAFGKKDITYAVEEAHGWASVLTTLQRLPEWEVELTLASEGSETPKTKVLKSQPVADWFQSSDRGMVLAPLLIPKEADSASTAFRMGFEETRDAAVDIYLTLRGLFTGNISPKELHGPIGILSIGVEVANSGLARFLIFLGFLSINLAVLNFLPIPVLDGGHMMFLLWEGVTRKRPSERVYATAMYLGLLFVLGLMSYVIFRDVVRLIVPS
ncbi:MAG: RIP metalloprotease RseP [Planctomycetaceae bacterium]